MKVLVVGAGIVGCASAYELARRGCHVDVVDRRGPGFGATHASAGILAPYIEGHLDAVLRLGLRSLSLYPEFVERVRRDAAQPIEFQRSGTLQVARPGPEQQSLIQTAHHLAAAGVPHELARGADAQRLAPALDPSIAMALAIPEHGYVRVGELLAALIAAGSGRVTFRRADVRSVEPSGSGVRVQVDREPCEADAVVIAAGSWSSALIDGSAPIKPIRGQLVEMRCAARPFSHVIWGESCYMVPWCDGSVLVGATSEDAGFDETIGDEATARLVEAGRQLVPSLRSAEIRDVRVGLRPATPDELPVIGRSAAMPSVVYATGHYRHGILLAPLTAQWVADIVTETAADPLLELVRPSRFGL